MGKVALIGGGSFGTALAITLANNGKEVRVYSHDNNVANDINFNKRNDKYLKGVEIPKGIEAFTNIDETLKGAEYVVLSVPSHAIRIVCKQLRSKINRDTIVVSTAKGIEADTNLRLSEVIASEIDNPVVVISGPTHAEEVAIGIPTAIVVSSNDMISAQKVQDLFMSNSFRVYTNEDLIGVEIGGAVKNIIALAAGVLDGMSLGDNTKAALMTRGMVEIGRIGQAMGGETETFSGLTGMGDLIVTCTSMHSRNRRAGILIGKGKSMDEAIEEIGMVVEGVKACKAFYELKEKLNVEMPITDLLYKVLFQGHNALEGVTLLMEREKKSEV